MAVRKIEFLYQSLADTQATIRAIDVKLGFLFAITAIPLVGAKDILCAVKEMAAYSSLFAVLAVIITQRDRHSVVNLLHDSQLSPITQRDRHLVVNLLHDSQLSPITVFPFGH